jgi:hypothetical protein
MASDEIRAFWNEGVKSERERVLLRISQGTKATSPAIRSTRRLNPGFYFNPLPDNSSGSKIRPFDLAKDESGRPNAMMKVAMRQRGELPITGGVKDYQYAKSILNRRARDASNLALEAQGLPPQAEPIATLSELDSRNLELNLLLQNIQNQIEGGLYSQLTINDLKGLPRILISVLPSYSTAEATDLLRFINDDILAVLRDAELNPKIVGRLADFFELVKKFLVEMMPLMERDEASKRRASITIGKRIFGTRFAEAEPAPIAPRRRPQVAPVAEVEDEEGEEEEDGEDEEVEIEEEVPAPAPRQQIRQEEGIISQTQLANLRRAFRTNDTDTLEEFIRESFPRLMADKYFRSRTTMANTIRDRLGVNIK